MKSGRHYQKWIYHLYISAAITLLIGNFFTLEDSGWDLGFVLRLLSALLLVGVGWSGLKNRKRQTTTTPQNRLDE